MQKFFASSQNITDEKIIISEKEQVHHIKDVLRLKLKEKVKISDNKGNEYLTEITGLLPEKIILTIKERLITQEQKMKLTVACAIPKQAKIDDIIDKLTQLGVDRIIPMLTQRVIVKIDKAKSKERLLRLQKIALSAAQQSKRRTLPLIDPLKNIKEVFLESKDFDLKLIPALFSQRKTLKEILSGKTPKNILALIGPEGDFTDEEMQMALKSGFVPVTLGELVLRVDTAAVTVASFIKLYADD